MKSDSRLFATVSFSSNTEVVVGPHEMSEIACHALIYESALLPKCG